MKVTVEMFDGTRRKFEEVDETEVRTEFDRIIIHQDNWSRTTIIPTDSFISFVEENP